MGEIQAVGKGISGLKEIEMSEIGDDFKAIKKSAKLSVLIIVSRVLVTSLGITSHLQPRTWGHT